MSEDGHKAFCSTRLSLINKKNLRSLVSGTNDKEKTDEIVF